MIDTIHKIRAIRQLEKASMPVSSFANPKITVVRLDEAEAIINSINEN